MTSLVSRLIFGSAGRPIGRSSDPSHSTCRAARINWKPPTDRPRDYRTGPDVYLEKV